MSELRYPVDASDHVIGDDDAPVTLVEYGDYQCPHCQAAHPLVEALLNHFGRDVRFAYRHFPLTTAHPIAKPAAESAEFAGSIGRFWDTHEALFANGHRLSLPNLLVIAEHLGLDKNKLCCALANHTYSAKVERDFAGGIRSGVNGTPCFFINGRRHDGSYDAVSLGGAIQKALGQPTMGIPMSRV